MVTYVKQSGPFADFPRKIFVMGTPDDPRCKIVDSHASVLPGGACKYEETQSCVIDGSTLLMSLAVDIPRDPVQFTGTMLLDHKSSVGTYRVTFAKHSASR